MFLSIFNISSVYNSLRNIYLPGIRNPSHFSRNFVAFSFKSFVHSINFSHFFLNKMKLSVFISFVLNEALNQVADVPEDDMTVLVCTVCKKSASVL